MEQSQNNTTETFEQKIIRNVKAGAFAVYKTPNVVGDKNMIANVEWEDPNQVDKFFAFAKSLSAKVIYVAEEDEEDEETHTTKTNIIQVGFLHDGVMHHINLDDEDEDDDEDDEEYEDEEGEYDEDEHEEHHESAPITSQPQPTPQPSPQPQQPAEQQQAPQQPSGQQPWPKPQF